MFCLSHHSGVEPGYREQAVASLSGSMAPATQRVSSLYPATMSGGAAQKCSAQSQSPAPRWERLIQPAQLHYVVYKWRGLWVFICVFGFHRRTTTPPLHESGEKQSDHLYLSGAPHAHLSLTTLHPPATEESPGTSGEEDALCTCENTIYLTINQSGGAYPEMAYFKCQKPRLYYMIVFLIKQFTLIGQ